MVFQKSYLDENYLGTSLPTSPNSLNIKDAAVNSVQRWTVDILSKAQINPRGIVSYASDCPNSQTKVMDGLFKPSGNRI